MIKNLLLSLEHILEAIGKCNPEILKDIREGASLADLNEKYNLHLGTWNQATTPLLAKYVNDKDLIRENQLLKTEIKELTIQLDNVCYNKNSKIAEISENLTDYKDIIQTLDLDKKYDFVYTCPCGDANCPTGPECFGGQIIKG